MGDGVGFGEYLHMQSPDVRYLHSQVYRVPPGRRLRMIKEVEVDPDGSLTRRWGAKADDVRVKRTMAALEANGMTVLRASDAAAAKRIVLDLIPDASPVHQGASQTLDVLGITYERSEEHTSELQSLRH